LQAIGRTSGRFEDPARTAKGEPRAWVRLEGLRRLWFNTGTVCNLSCAHCFMESGPRNDTLSWLSRDDIRPYLDEVDREGLSVADLGFTGGEPFANPAILDLLEEGLGRGFRALVLTNATRPMLRHRGALAELRHRYGDALRVRVSLDHHDRTRHEEQRGDGAWEAAVAGLRWLAGEGFPVTVAGRLRWGEPERALRAGYADLFASLGVALDARSPEDLVLFAEMDPARPVPEISEACWGILGRSPETLMCATGRMVVRRKGDGRPVVVACTLLPHDLRFELGRTLAEAGGAVALNHPYCAQFCVLGGGRCGGG